MANSSSSSSAGIGFFGLLTIVLITLKLCGVITLPWLWVAFPIWAPLVVLGVLGVIILAVMSVKKE